MKNFFLSAVLVILGSATANSQGINPVPNCYPCNNPPVTLASTQIIPVPNCYPCADPPVTTHRASVREMVIASSVFSLFGDRKMFQPFA